MRLLKGFFKGLLNGLLFILLIPFAFVLCFCQFFLSLVLGVLSFGDSNFIPLENFVDKFIIFWFRLLYPQF